jgi:hypothetical protein
MVNYKCPRCGYEINIKTKYMNHLRRKRLCNPILSNNNLQEEYIKYKISDKICYFNDTAEIPQKTAEMTKTTAEIPQKNAEIKKISVKYSKKNKKITKCKFCDKEFIRKDSLPRHLKTCKEKLKDEEERKNLLDLINVLNKKLDEKDKQLEKRDRQFEEILNKKDKQIDELIKKAGINIGTQNIQQNINILAYKNTDISHLTDRDYLKCLKHSNFCIPHLIEKIHFNPKKPENHNIYISNLKNNYAMIYDGNKWTLKDREDEINKLIDDKEMIIEQKLEEWIENGEKYPDAMKKFSRYLEKKENDKVLNKVKSEIKLMLFNNRNVVSKE